MQNEAYMTPIQGKIENWNSGFIKLMKYCKVDASCRQRHQVPMPITSTRYSPTRSYGWMRPLRSSALPDISRVAA